ncbi:MAG TPA: DUF2703 domain-containing protein [bacterium]
MKKFLIFGALLVLILAACSKQGAPLTLVIQWQKADTDACLACQNTAVQAKDIQKAFEKLTKELAAKGIRVELVEKKAEVDTANPELANGQIWMGNVPVDGWLNGAATQGKICPACPAGPRGKGHLHKSLVVDGQVYDPIPVDLMVRAGLAAAGSLKANPNTDNSH